MTDQCRRLLRYFEYGHLAEPMRSVSEQFHETALKVANMDAVDPAEQTVALRKLLEAKDCAVRCVLT